LQLLFCVLKKSCPQNLCKTSIIGGIQIWFLAETWLVHVGRLLRNIDPPTDNLPQPEKNLPQRSQSYAEKRQNYYQILSLDKMNFNSLLI